MPPEEPLAERPRAPGREGSLGWRELRPWLLQVERARDRIERQAQRFGAEARAEGVDVDTVPVADIGSTNLVWIDREDSIGDAAEEMMKDYVRHALVRDESGLVGVLSMRDVLSAYTT